MDVIILAGGHGTRLWPLSREFYPKQFLKFDYLGGKSLFQLCFLRALKISAIEDIYIVTSENHKFLVMGEIEELGEKCLESNIIVEKESKNTLPSITLSMKYINEYALVLPSDQLIEDDRELLNSLDFAQKLANKNLITFGIYPNNPHTGYGYIKYNENKVEKFIEKPNKEDAKDYLEKGYIWNSGIFLFKKTIFLEELSKYNEQLYNLYVSGTLEQNYSDIKNLSIDYGILENSSNVGVVPLNISWTDLGSFDSLYEAFSDQDDTNVGNKNVLFEDSSNNLVYGTSSNKFIGLKGVNDLVVVDTDDALMICSRNNSQNVKELVKTLKREKPDLLTYHTKVYRPWGNYVILQDCRYFKVKKLTILPGKKLSLQLHYKRSEHWVIVKGEAQIIKGDQELDLLEGESIEIPCNTKHRIKNNSNKTLEIIETQTGSYFGEDDIVRFKDEYGRL